MGGAEPTELPTFDAVYRVIDFRLGMLKSCLVFFFTMLFVGLIATNLWLGRQVYDLQSQVEVLSNNNNMAGKQVLDLRKEFDTKKR